MSERQDEKDVFREIVGMLFYCGAEVLRKHYGFGSKRLRRYFYGVNHQMIIITKNLCTYEEYIDNMETEIHLERVRFERPGDTGKKRRIYLTMNPLAYNAIYTLRDRFGFGEKWIKKFLELFAEEIREYHQYDELGNFYWDKYGFKFSVKYMTLRSKNQKEEVDTDEIMRIRIVKGGGK